MVSIENLYVICTIEGAFYGIYQTVYFFYFLLLFIITEHDLREFLDTDCTTCVSYSIWLDQ